MVTKVAMTPTRDNAHPTRDTYDNAVSSVELVPLASYREGPNANTLLKQSVGLGSH